MSIIIHYAADLLWYCDLGTQANGQLHQLICHRMSVTKSCKQIHIHVSFQQANSYTCLIPFCKHIHTHVSFLQANSYTCLLPTSKFIHVSFLQAYSFLSLTSSSGTCTCFESSASLAHARAKREAALHRRTHMLREQRFIGACMCYEASSASLAHAHDTRAAIHWHMHVLREQRFIGTCTCYEGSSSSLAHAHDKRAALHWHNHVK
jgi:hypothetical protein